MLIFTDSPLMLIFTHSPLMLIFTLSPLMLMTSFIRKKDLRFIAVTA